MKTLFGEHAKLAMSSTVITGPCWARPVGGGGHHRAARFAPDRPADINLDNPDPPAIWTTSLTNRVLKSIRAVESFGFGGTNGTY